MHLWNAFQKRKKRVYLDHAAATPLRAEVFALMRPWFLHTGNPSAIHAEGVVAREAIEASREELARTRRVRASEITYTSGGTESNNLALQGVVRALRTAGRKNNDIEILSTKIEHPSILETLRLLEAEGVGVRYVAVDADLVEI